MDEEEVGDEDEDEDDGEFKVINKVDNDELEEEEGKGDRLEMDCFDESGSIESLDK